MGVHRNLYWSPSLVENSTLASSLGSLLPFFTYSRLLSAQLPEWDWKCKVKHFNVFSSLSTLESKSLPRPTKPPGTILRTQSGVCALEGPVLVSLQMYYQLHLPTHHQMRSLQVSGMRTTGVYSPLTEYAPVTPESRMPCPGVCKPASQSAIYSCMWSKTQTKEVALRQGWEWILEPFAGVRVNLGSITWCPCVCIISQNTEQELKMEREGGRPRTRANSLFTDLE